MAKKKLKTFDATLGEPASNATPNRPACQACGLFRTSPAPFALARVPKDWNSQLLLVSEAPTRDEDRQPGYTFSGKEGKWLEALLARKGFKREDCALTYTVRCTPPKDAQGKPLPPTMGQIRYCRPFLLADIATLKPRNIMGLGNAAARGLLNDGQATVVRHRGRLLLLTPKEESRESNQAESQTEGSRDSLSA